MNPPRTLTTARDRGSAVIEAVMLAPVLMLFIILVLFGGRWALAQQAVQASAAEAARAASLARTADQAHASAASAAGTSLTNQQVACASQSVTVDTAGFAVPVGQPAMVAATVTCVVDMNDLAAPGVPGTRTLTATMRSPLDTYRARQG